MQHNAAALECICPYKICTEGGIHKSLDILATARLLGVRHWMTAAEAGLGGGILSRRSPITLLVKDALGRTFLSINKEYTTSNCMDKTFKPATRKKKRGEGRNMAIIYWGGSV